MAKILLAIFGKSWAPTTIAYLVALMELYQGYKQGGMDWKHAAVAALIALFGRVVKQSNVTGGTVPATVEAEKRTTANASAPSAESMPAAPAK